LYAGPSARSKPRQAGLILGYASLDVEQIRKGVRALGAALDWVVEAP